MEKKEIKTLEDCVTPEGLRISGMGILAGNTAAILEKLDKIQKFLFFMEKRQNKWKREFDRLHDLPEEQEFDTK